MIVVASANGEVGMDAAWDVLAAGGSALDAVEAGTRLVEDNPADHTVGYGGYPNLLGAVELDASIMDGDTRRAGAVAALRGHRHAVTVARRVMEELPHVLLTGEGAERFAAEIGMEQEDVLTDDAARVWREGIEGRLPAHYRNAAGDPSEAVLRRAARLATDPERPAGTVNFLAQDGRGHVASAVSTSGWAWKYPGRAGDSPVVGAGNYADDRYGAATCTGLGELAIRSGTALRVVCGLEAGRSLEDSSRRALLDLATLGADPRSVILHVVALDRHGGHVGVSTRQGSRYVYRADGMAAAETVDRIFVDD